MSSINFGCGISVAADWKNYDGSPTLWIQRLPLLGVMGRALIAPLFPPLAMYGDIVKGLPEPSGSADWVYCSHVLEHLSLCDFRKALSEVSRLLNNGGVFRGVLPDLAYYARNYVESPDYNACSRFMESTGLGVYRRGHGFSGLLREALGNSRHLWMWDFNGLSGELRAAGFVDVRRAHFRDSLHTVFNAVEDRGRWENCLGFECRK